MSTACLLAPLRAWRRALGALVLTGVDSGELDEAQLVEFAYELGHQLSVGIENVQLLEEILRQRRLLEDTFNSLVDLVVVTDRDSRIVQVNDAFASRVGVPRVETIGRPLRELVGEDTALWVRLRIRHRVRPRRARGRLRTPASAVRSC